jgi:predicted dehydrogenase
MVNSNFMGKGSHAYKVGIIGPGWVAENRHIPAFKLERRCRLYGVYGLPEYYDKVKEFARRNKIPHAYLSLDEMLKDVDIVAICTPPDTHAELAIAAMKYGRHVLVEKPMATSVNEAREMVRTAEKVGVKLAVNHNFLFANAVRETHRVLEEGSIGELDHIVGLYMSGEYRRLPQWISKLPGGLFYDEIPHYIYLFREFAGNLTVKWSKVVIHPENGQPVKVFAELDGSKASIQLCALLKAPISLTLLGIIGTRGVCVIDLFRDIVWCLQKRKRSLLSKSILALSLSGRLLMDSIKSEVRYRTGHLFGQDRIIKDFIDAIEKNRSPRVTGEDGEMTIKIIHEILKKKSGE